ncbi:MAG: Multidrug resistance protein stp [candidate division WS6 bacterium OLB20]|uniref:Multidrug resistance protein stp n=1 Tax=candidate division WS6 bacterium OLB20 TaxID=1617426 RepID=A0A136LZC6_9BACT|nr:MAG: Multidrug resistance protein stp [candidate division WS6 bacterium OLB20]
MKLTSRQGLFVLSSTILASGMAFLMGSAVNLAIPDIQSDLNATLIEIQWILNSYALVLAVFILISGSLSDRFGRRNIFAASIVLFTLGSVLSGTAVSSLQLIVFRLLQGLGGALMIPGSLAIISSAYPASERGKAIGLWSGLSGGVAALGGPVVGGVFVEQFGWRSVFLMILPLGLLAFGLCMSSIPRQEKIDRKPVNILSVVLSLLGLSLLVTGLMYGPDRNWDHYIWLILLIGITVTVLFLLYDVRSRNPLISPELYKNQTVLGANLATLFLYTALNGFFFFLVINLQQLQMLSPSLAGFALLPTVLIITLLSGAGGALADRYSNRMLMTAGSFIVAIGMALLAVAGYPAVFVRDFLPGQVLIGLGMAVVIAPLTKSALEVPEGKAGMASGLNNAVSRIAAVFAVALMGALLISVFTSQLEQQLKESDLLSVSQTQIFEQADSLLAIEIPDNYSSAEAEETRMLIADSFVPAYRTTTFVAAGFAAAAAVTSFVFIDRERNLLQQIKAGILKERKTEN